MFGVATDDFSIMEGKMAEKEKDKGFTVRDKRIFAEGKEKAPQEEKKEERREPPKAEQPQEQKAKDAKPEEETPLPEINFANFIFSLSTSALIQLGEIPDPVSKESSKNLPLAKQTIDILGLLQEKTKGNLTADEETLIQNILYDLRMRYVKAKD